MKHERDPDRKTDWDYEAMQWREPETRVGFVQVGLCIIAAQILWLVFLS